MAERNMTPEELREFEEETLQHRSEDQPDSGPASEPEIVDRDREAPAPPVPPNPD